MSRKPMPASKKMAKDFTAYFPKNFKAEGKNWNQMTSFQAIEDDRKTTDVHLTCTDGFVPAHAFLLCSFSEFIKTIFLKQGEDYSGVRLVLLPDFKIAQVSKVVQLMYSGTTEVDGPEEARKIRDILKTLQIDLHDLEYRADNDAKNSPAPDEVIHYLFTPEAIKKQEEEMSDYGHSSGEETVPVADDLSIPSVSSNQSDSVPTSPVSAHQNNPREGSSDESESEPASRKGRRTLRPRASLTKKISAQKMNKDSEESDEKNSGSEDLSEEDESGLESSESEVGAPITKRTTRNAKPNPKTGARAASSRTRVPAKQNTTKTTPIIVNSDNDSNPIDLDNSSESELDDGLNKSLRKTSPKKNIQVKADSNPQDRKRPPPTSDTSSDSDSDKAEDKKSMYKNPDLFEELAKVCGKCKKKYKTAKEASDCITEKHGYVRCYFCFDVCPNTEKLFVHYGDKHQKAGRENTLLCPFCQGSVPYKSVSTHVISNHLFAAKQINAGAGVGTGRGRPPNTSAPTQEIRPGPKRMKVALASQSQKGDPRKKANDTSESDEEDDHIQTSNTLIKKKSANGVMKTFLLGKEK